MTKPAKKITVGSDFDPAKETARDAKGTPVTDSYINSLAEEAEAGYDLNSARRVGRPSLTGAARHSPRVSFRVSDAVRERAEHAAKREGKTVSQLAREALERYLAS